MLAIPGMLTPDRMAQVRRLIDDADWIDGNATSGHQSARAKRNRQLPEDSVAAREAGAIILDALAHSPHFVAAALPLKVYPPLFNRYGTGEAFAPHVDSAIRIRAGSDFRIRTDLSATLFLEDPAAYDGGELVVTTPGGGEQAARLGAGDLLLYSAASVHHVAAVTRGTRTAAFFWVQSMVREADARAMLLELDEAIRTLDPDAAATVRLTGVYHNLLRRFADA